MVATCEEAGVLGVLPGVIGLIQATEVLKLILGVGKILNGVLLSYEALEMEFKRIKVRRDPDCPVCGDHPVITDLIDYEEFCRVNY
jgi:adenylyltransferase/sulfurtransferase